MIIIIKDTGELTSPEQLRITHPHVMFDFADINLVSQALEEHGMAVVNMPSQPVFDSRLQYIEPMNIVETDGVYSGEWSEPQMIEVVSQELIKQLIAEKRWMEECCGVTYNGKRYPSDRQSQQVISTMFFMANMNPDYSVKFKSLEGFVDLTAADIIGLGAAVHDHVQAAFNREAELLATPGATHLDW